MNPIDKQFYLPQFFCEGRGLSKTNKLEQWFKNWITQPNPSLPLPFVIHFNPFRLPFFCNESLCFHFIAIAIEWFVCNFIVCYCYQLQCWCQQ